MPTLCARRCPLAVEREERGELRSHGNRRDGRAILDAHGAGMRSSRADATVLLRPPNAQLIQMIIASSLLHRLHGRRINRHGERRARDSSSPEPHSYKS
jgi:hypothetical protein